MSEFVVFYYRTSIPGNSIGPPSSVTSNFNMPKVLSHVGPSPLGTKLYCTFEN